GAEAPNPVIPMTAPVNPVYLAHPRVEACSTATRAITAGGRTEAQYSGVCFSNSSHEGMLTTRAFTPDAVSCSYASTQSDTSLPVAIRITSGAPPGASARTYAPLARPEAGAYLLRSKVGIGCRVSTSTQGWRFKFSATRQASTTSFASAG